MDTEALLSDSTVNVEQLSLESRSGRQCTVVTVVLTEEGKEIKGLGASCFSDQDVQLLQEEQ